MSLQKITHIEGLDSHYEDVEMQNDLDPSVNRIEFLVMAVEMPFLSAKENRLIKKNFVWIKKTINLGNLIVQRRIRDTVIFDEETKKWKIQLLAKRSDIRQYPEEWNRFALGSSDNSIGTPLSVLFKNDPAKCDMFKYHHIYTVEQLALLGQTHLEQLPAGTMQDISIAKSFLAKAKEDAPKVELDFLLKKKDEEILSLNNRLSDLTEKLDELLTHRFNATGKKKKGRPKMRKDHLAESSDVPPVNSESTEAVV